MSRFFLGRLFSRLSLINAVGFCLLAGSLALLVGVWLNHNVSSQGNQIPVTTVSAASFETGTLAPESIVSAYGVALATTTLIANASPLPTSLAGTSVKVKDSRGTERLAPLFFVSPGQINYQIPPGTATGIATVTVTSGDGKVSTGSAQIANAAPSLFTANATGQGVPAATLFRLKADGAQSFEPATRFDSATGGFVPLPIDLGAEGDQVFLLLFGTGFKFNGGLGNVKVRIGGVDAEVSYADAAPGFTGLDQANVRLPRRLIGSGRVTLSLSVNDFSASNLVELEIAGAPNIAPPQINGYSAATVLAGQLLTINGAGFSPNATDNLVRLGGLEARVVSASATQLTIRIPFGAASDVVSVRTPQGEGRGANPLQMRTSISGVVQDTRSQPLAGVKVRASGSGIEATTGAEGSFLLPDVPPSPAQFVEIDGGIVSGTLPYPKVILKLRVLASRDNQLNSPVALQQITGPGAQVGGPSFVADRQTMAFAAPEQTSVKSLRVGEVVFEFSASAGISFPDGARQGTVNLTLVENSRTPVKLPPGLFSTTIPQISPLGAVLLGGGRLTLPNQDAYPAGTLVKLYRFDQIPGSSTLGEFTEAGTATVSTDGQRIETAPNAITEITQYFAALPRQTTTLTGRVVDSDGTTSVRQAVVRCRGQETVTDGNGGFILRGVEVNAGDKLSVEASFLRPNARVDRVQRINIEAVVNGLTVVMPDLILPAEDSNRAPVLLAPAVLRVNEGETREVNFVVFDPDGQSVQLALSGASFASLTNRGNNIYTLRLQTRTNDAGRYTLGLTATDSLAQSTTLNVALSVNRPPIANPQTVITDEDAPRAITLTGSDPDGDPLSFEIVNNPLHGRLSGTPPTLSYTPDARYTGSDSFTFKVNDGLADSAPATVSIAVNPVNHRPTLTVLPAQTVNEGQELSFTVTASDIDIGQTLSFTATNLPGGASFTQTSGTTARFVWTPSFTQAGSYTVSFRVTDNGVPAQNDTKTVALTVRDVNRAPTLMVPGAQTVAAGQNVSFTVSATDPDVGQTVALSAEDLPPSATFNPANGLFSWTPNAPQAGAYTLTFNATDNGSLARSVTAVVALTVTMQWKAAKAIEGGYIFSFYNDGPNLFAGGRGIYRSTNNGQSWTDVDSRAAGSAGVFGFVRSGTNLFAGGDAGVHVSANNGQSWAAVNIGLTNTAVRSLAVSGENLFVGTFDGVFRSSNQGQNWTAAKNGLPPNTRIQSLLVSGINLFAGTFANGVFLSTNDGQSWTAINQGLLSNANVTSLVMSGVNLFASGSDGVYLSVNNGQNWTAVNAGLTGNFVNALVVSNETLFAATNAGSVFRSTNQGQSWTATNFGLPSGTFTSLGVSGSSVFAGASHLGIFVSSDSGQSWMAASTGYASASIGALMLNGTNVFAGAEPRGVFLSTDLGDSWIQRSSGLSQSSYTAFATMGNDLYLGTGAGVFRSTNQGQSWTRVNSGLTNQVALALLVAGSNLFAGTENGVFLSTNQGQTWIAANAGVENIRVNTLAVMGNNLFAGTNGSGVFVSSNNGQSWTAVNTGLTNVFISSLIVSGSNLLAGTIGNCCGIFVSSNNGQNWVVTNTGLTDLNINRLVINGTNIFAGTNGGGIFASTNGGESWISVSAGLDSRRVVSLAVNDSVVVVGTFGGRVFISQ